MGKGHECLPLPPHLVDEGIRGEENKIYKYEERRKVLQSRWVNNYKRRMKRNSIEQTGAMQSAYGI